MEVNCSPFNLTRYNFDYYNYPDQDSLFSTWKILNDVNNDNKLHSAFKIHKEPATALGATRGYSYNAGGTLTIPDTVDAYLNFTDNSGSGKGLVAVGKSANFLFYTASENTLTKETEYCTQVTGPEQKTNSDGDLLYTLFSYKQIPEQYLTSPPTPEETTKLLDSHFDFRRKKAVGVWYADNEKND